MKLFILDANMCAEFMLLSIGSPVFFFSLYIVMIYFFLSFHKSIPVGFCEG